MSFGGGFITRRPLAYSQDGKYILTPSDDELRIYSALTGELVSSLHGHGAEVTCAVLDPRNAHQVPNITDTGFKHVTALDSTVASLLLSRPGDERGSGN